jgi:hypothetical protein
VAESGNNGRGGRAAKEVFTQSGQRDSAIKQEQEKAHAATAAKIARLRALRLAAEKQAAESASAAPAPAPTRRSKVIRKS